MDRGGSRVNHIVAMPPKERKTTALYRIIHSCSVHQTFIFQDVHKCTDKQFRVVQRVAYVHYEVFGILLILFERLQVITANNSKVQLGIRIQQQG